MVDRFGQVSGDFSLERHGARGAFGTVATSSPLFGGIQIAGGAPFDPLSLNPILAFEASRSMLAAGDAAAANLDLVATLENRAFLNAVETGSPYGTSLSGSLSGSTATHNQVAPAVAGEFYRIRFTASNVAVRGRVRYRNYAGNADVSAVDGLGSLEYFYTDGAYEAFIPSDAGLSLWFYPESGWDYSGVSVQQISKFPANATQTTASNQSRAHVPVGDGHLYLPAVSGNYASVPDADNLDGFGDFAMEFVGSSEDWHAGLALSLIGKWTSSGGYFVRLQANGTLFFLYNTSGGQNYHYSTASHNLVDGEKGGIRVIRDGSSIKFYENLYAGNGWQQIGSPVSGSATTLVNGSQPLEVGTYNGGTAYPFNGSVISSKVWNSASPDTASPVLDIDFSDGDHKASAFDCSTGQTVTINKSGNDPATIVRRNFLRFDGADNFMTGAFNESNTTGGYMFAVFSVNGNGGEQSSRVFSINSSDIFEKDFNNIRSFIFSLKYSGTNDLAFYYNSVWRGIHADAWDASNGAILHEIKAVDGNQISKINNADPQTNSQDLSALSSEQFNIGHDANGASNPAIDLEALYLFDETLTDEDATKVRDYLNAKSSIY